MDIRNMTQKLLGEKIERYFAQEESVKSLPGLALFLGIDSGVLAQLLSDGNGHAALMRQAKARIEKDIVENSLRGKYNATMSSFLLKTAFGYSEKSEQGAPGSVRIELSDELKKFAV